MAYSSLLSLSFCFLVLFHGCFARIELVTNRVQSQSEQQQQSQQNQCQLQNLNALKPQHQFKSEAGVTEFWDQNEQQFQCAGVAFFRHRIQSNGLLLPSFNNAPQLVYVVEGQGIQGAVFPGCPETFQAQSQSQQSKRGQSFRDQHQKIRQIKKGDVLALPTGVAHWIYNNGQSQLVLVSLVDVSNNDNQLDQNFRKFFLAGNPQEGLVTGGQRQSSDQNPEQESENEGNNVLSGFDEKLLAEVFNIDTRLARKLQNENDERGAIVKVERELQFRTPEEIEEEQTQQGGEEEEEDEEEQEQGSEEEEEEERGGRRKKHVKGSRKGQKGKRRSRNGLEETFCTMRLKHMTDSSFPDVFNPRAGRITTVNNFNFPVLVALQLSAERGVLYKNAIFAPHWNMNAHSIVYVTNGSARIQIVSENGEAVFDDEVEEGQVITVPQNFVVVKKAGREGFEWIAFKTNSNAKTAELAGHTSVFRAIPVEVLANSFRISREEANRLKQNWRDVSLLAPGRGSQQ
ncbi:hypothetical protein PTKIN_Ptkin10aG0038700 [Pterospermum kingtungense]